MGLYRYEAVDKTGRVLHGAMNASDEQVVSDKLAAMGYSVRAVFPAGGAPKGSQMQPISATGGQPAPAPGGRASGIARVTVGSGTPVSIKSLVPADRLSMFFRQLVTLVRSGIPLYQSFADLANATRDRRLRAAIPQMQQALQASGLSGAMAMFPDLFPAHTIACVWSGEISGKLDVILDELAADMERESSDTRYGKIGWGLTKGTLIGTIITLPLFNIGTLLAPVVGEVSGAGTPAGYAASFLQVWLRQIMLICVPIALAVMASWFAWGWLKRIPSVRRALDGALLHVPVWGNLHRSRSIAKFLGMLDHLYSAGISPATAWDAACITPRNSAIAERLKSARMESAAVSVADMAAMSGVFDQEDVGLLAAGEKAGQVPESLTRLAELYRDRADGARSVGRAWSISNLILFQIVVAGVVVIFLTKTYADVLMKMMP